MTSQINPANIDGTYPIAGQDNNSQGFRTNFTNTSTNFQYAKEEITDLQNKVVLKTALTGTTLNNDMQGSPLSNALLSDMAETVVSNLPTTGTVTINYAAGPVQVIGSSTGSISLNFTTNSWPTAGQSGTVAVQVTISNTAHTLTLPSAVSVNATGIVGYLNNVITFPTAGTYTFTFSTIDAGTTITVNETNKLLQPFNASGDFVGNGQACSLATTNTKFTTTGAWTATLAAGTLGQTKELIMVGDGGDMVITVTNAGWKSSGTGTITFTAIGQACILRYSDYKWFCTGNNGCTFA